MKKSYLLAIDGSQESLQAAELAWTLAKRDNAKIVAQTVVDIQSIWDILAPEAPGLVGSGPYVAAREAIKTALQSISESLVVAYEARARGQNIVPECVIDEGYAAQAIVKRAKEHDLVIMGHRQNRPRRTMHGGSGIVSYSLSEEVAHRCPTPLLIVQHRQKPWKSARLVVSDETFNAACLKHFLDFITPHTIPLEIYCVGPESKINLLLKEVKKTIPASPEIKVLAQDPGEGDNDFDCAIDVSQETLLVITTTTAKEERQTCAGTSLEYFVRYSTPATVLILPPEVPAAAMNSPSPGIRGSAR